MLPILMDYSVPLEGPHAYARFARSYRSIVECAYA